MHGDPDDKPLWWERVAISARKNPHGKVSSLAYRIEDTGRSVVYASDAGYAPGGPSERVLELYHGADLLIHDATYTPEDQAQRLARGYSSFADAAYAATRAQVQRLALFHYDQDYTDDHVDQCWRRCRALLDETGGAHIELIAAREGLTVTL
jgi:ribonuclease BN (tRNA processing enzyme)